MTRTLVAPGPVFDHLLALSDGGGLHEHARHDVPRPEHGYCVDDESRALVVLCREPRLGAGLHALAERCLDLVAGAIAPDGRCHNRHDTAGSWTDEAGLDDVWGRAVWALGFAAVHAPSDGMRATALVAFRTATAAHPTQWRPLVFAALGAGELLLARPDETAARDLLRRFAAETAGRPGTPAWPWPEPRLAYSNGSVAEAVILAGHALGDRAVLGRGLALLDFLLAVETSGGHLSVTPVGGRGPLDVAPAFDQQPIEVAALADACARAHAVTGDERWRAAVGLAAAWFLGDNDSSTPMVDPATGAGYDGLQRLGRNDNRGAESTLAALSTLQQLTRGSRS